MKTKLSTMKKKVWKLCSEYNRRKDANGDMAQCVTCGKIAHWKELHAGHFIAKGNGNSVYFEDTNIHAQCPRCNMFDEGNKENYYPYMLNRYGQDEVDRLMALKHQAVKFSRADYEQMMEDYKEKLADLDG
jgi:hypothetical protein